MRMWNIKPSLMCNKHLIGEHCECHMFVGTINKVISIEGYINKKLVETHNIKKRHNQLVKEMKRRNIKHKTPLKHIDKLKKGKINVEENMKTISERCKECKRRIEND